MPAALHEQRIHCPYCGEAIDILLDLSVDEQELIEDCQVCCQPMSLHYGTGLHGEIFINVDRAQ